MVGPEPVCRAGCVTVAPSPPLDKTHGNQSEPSDWTDPTYFSQFGPSVQNLEQGHDRE